MVVEAKSKTAKFKKHSQKRYTVYIYTNADQFINKREDLVMFISNDKPDIMMITEVIPKKQENPITQELLDTDGYKCALNFDPYEPNLGASGIRGVAISYSDSLIASAVKFNAQLLQRIPVHKALPR